MLNLQPPSNARKAGIGHGIDIYYYHHLPHIIRSFADALDPSVWRNYFQPFACVIANPQSNEVLLVRDHLGVAPLYYCHYLGKTLLVGETIPEILKQLPSAPPLLESQIEALFSEYKCYSDETLYQGIYRVEPGHMMHFKSNGSVSKKAFWQLEPQGDLLHYEDEHEYLDHFSILMTESIKNSTENQQNIAAEFSAGLDSSAVYCAAASINVKPKLFMHIASPGTNAATLYNDHYEKSFIDHYQLTDIQRIGADDFDPIRVFNEYAELFAGPAPYLFFMFAHNLFRAVATGGHPILLSGFGGDQGVSGIIPPNFFMHELIRQRGFRQACHMMTETPPNSRLRQLKQALLATQYLHPHLYEVVMKMKNIKIIQKNTFQQSIDRVPPITHPYLRKHYNSVREAEWFFLQGPFSHEVRMRIEYSSLISKKMGFEYRYPLLYPKLLEFFLSIPLLQKRRNGRGRYLLRQYISQFIPGDLFSNYKKKEGLAIVPSTFDLYKQKFEEGCYQQAFKDLPYPEHMQHKYHPIELRNNIKGYMLKAYKRSIEA